MESVVFTVDPDGLDTLRARLAEVQSCMQSIGDVSAGYDPLDLGPGGAVWQELQNFHDNWSNGLAMISRNMSALANLLSSAAQGYRSTESAIVTADGGSS